MTPGCGRGCRKRDVRFRRRRAARGPAMRTGSTVRRGLLRSVFSRDRGNEKKVNEKINEKAEKKCDVRAKNPR